MGTQDKVNNPPPLAAGRQEIGCEDALESVERFHGYLLALN
jgi:hypothetical protein